jgi:drug/metabolite transporter (DMT)-like permease
VIPLGLSQTIQNLVPLLVLIISYYALGETLKVFEIVNMLISLSGVIFIVSMSQSEGKDNPSKKEAT